MAIIAQISPSPTVRKNPLSRATYLGLGMTFLGLGLIGVVVPGMPTTVFCILALWCFKRSSAKMEQWLLQNRILGPTLRDWEANHWISMRVKTISISMIAVFVTLSCAMIHKPTPARTWMVRGFILAGGLIGVGYIATRRTKPSQLPTPALEAIE